MAWTIPEKKQREVGAAANIELIGVSKMNSKWNFHDRVKKRSRISRGDQKKTMWNFNYPGVLIFDLGIPIMGVKSICRISEDEALLCLKFPKLR